MSYEDAVNDIRNSLIAKPVFSEGLRHLDKDAEIRVLLDGRFETALFFDGQRAVLEERAAKNPDVEFSLSSDAIRILKEHPGEDLAKFGIEVVKQILVGSVRVRVCGSVWRVLTKGYLGLIQEAGPDFLKFLAENGLKNLSKITRLIRSLKS